MACPRLTPLALLLSLTYPLAHGADPTLPAVQVTAKGYAADDVDTPASTTTLDRRELDRRGAGNLGDALRSEPGLAIASDSAQGQNPVIRGLGRDSIVLLVDGMRFNSAQPAGAIASFMSLGFAEQVDVVRGGASVLYGTGALGGAINVILPQARFTPGVSGTAAASYDSSSQGLRGTALVNASEGDHAVMLGASVARIDDYRSPEGRVARTGYDSNAYIGQYRFRLDARQQLRVSLQLHQDKDVWYPGSTRPHAAPSVGTTIVRSPDQERRLAEIGYSRKGSGDAPVNLDVRLYRQEMERSIYSWANGLGRDIVTNTVTFATTGLDLKTDWLAHPDHLLSAGVNAWEMGGDPDRKMAAPASGFTTFTPNNPFRDARIQALGAYIQDDMRLGALKVLAGLRYDVVRGSADSMNNGARTSGLDRSESAVSGSLGAVYELSPLLRPYASYARAFRAPGMRERYESGLRGDGYYYAGSPEIEAETADQFEIGLKGRDGDFDYTLSAFHNRIANYITGQILAGTAATQACGAANAANCKKTVNLGSATLHGLEARGRWQFLRAQWLSVGYSRLRGTNNDLDEALFQMPADTLSLGWLGRLLPAVQGDFTLRLVDRQDRVATEFTKGSENPTAGFVTADMGASWQLDPRNTVRLAVRNLADRRYHEHLTEGISGQEILSPGRSVQLSWRGRF